MELEESGESDTDEGIISDIGTICDKDTTDEETEDQDDQINEENDINVAQINNLSELLSENIA